MKLPEAKVIAADPVFQLNVILWSLLPSEGGRYRSVLHQHGYFLHSIGRRLQLSGERREALAEVAGHGLPSPDVLADHESDPTMLVVECKASSFGSASSTSQQAMKLLVGGSDVADTIGASSSRPAHVLYATRSGDAALLWATLQELQSSLSTEGLPLARAGTLTIELRDLGAWLGLSHGDPPPAPLGDALSAPVEIVTFEEHDSPLPLYILPWDPGVEQDSRLADLGKAVIAARVLNEATAMIGRASLPESLTLNASVLIDAATFGASASWRSRSEVEKVESLAVSRLMKALRAVRDLEVVSHSNPHGIDLTLKSEEQRSAVIDALEKVDEWEALQGPEQPELDLA